MKAKRAAFLAAYRETGNVRVACEAAQISRSSIYRWLAQDPDYAEEFEQAKADAVDVLEAEARRRAVDGVEELVGWYKGQAGGTVRRYSDTLLIFLLKGLKPEVYRERLEVRGSIAKLDFSRLTDEQLSRIAGGEHPYAVHLREISSVVQPAVTTRSCGCRWGWTSVRRTSAASRLHGDHQLLDDKDTQGASTPGGYPLSTGHSYEVQHSREGPNPNRDLKIFSEIFSALLGPTLGYIG